VVVAQAKPQFWGWGPGGLVGFVLVVVIVLLVLGKI
jgi:hypothetical protein